MAKQRFVVYKAFDKHGEVLRYLLVVGGKSMPFAGDLRSPTFLSSTSAELMGRYGRSCFSTSEWRGFASRHGAIRIQKVIYFN